MRLWTGGRRKLQRRLLGAVGPGGRFIWAAGAGAKLFGVGGERLRAVGVHGAQGGEVGRPWWMAVDRELSELEETDCEPYNGGFVEKI